MADITQNIVIESTNLGITPNVASITFNPEPIQLNVFTQGAPGAGNSSQGQLLYNNGNYINGAANTFVSNGNVSFTNISNIKIAGGANAYFLQTDGTGNLTWAVGTANVSGNGTAAGANTQIQISDGTGNFTSGAGFTFNVASNILNVPGNVVSTGQISASGNITGSNVVGSNLYGNGYNITSINGANVSGTVGSATNVVGNNQPNITSVGTLIDLNVSNTKIHLGNNAGLVSQGASALAIGSNAGSNTQGAYGVAVGYGAGEVSQGTGAISIGQQAGSNTQSSNAIAIGSSAGTYLQGANSIAIGANAGAFSQAANSIVINATGAIVNASSYPNSFTVKPVRNANTANVLFYDSSSGEIVYDLVANLPANVANFANFAGNVTVASQPNITSVGNLVSLNVNGQINSNVATGNAPFTIKSTTKVANLYVDRSNLADIINVNASPVTTTNHNILFVNSALSGNRQAYINTSFYYRPNTDTLFTGTLSVSGAVYTPITTYINLGTAGTQAGARKMISDANTTTFYSVVGSGGANTVPVYSDGSNWRVG